LPRQESLREKYVDLFRTNIFEYHRLNDRIINGACDLIAADRTGSDLDSEMFSKAVNMFHEMQVYTRSFEPRMMEVSQEYVKTWADTESVERSLSGYVKSARALMDREMERVDVFSLPSTTKRELLTLLEDHLISRKETRLGNVILHVVDLQVLTLRSQSGRAC
jgi:cullin 4